MQRVGDEQQAAHADRCPTLRGDREARDPSAVRRAADDPGPGVPVLDEPTRSLEDLAESTDAALRGSDHARAGRPRRQRGAHDGMPGLGEQLGDGDEVRRRMVATCSGQQ